MIFGGGFISLKTLKISVEKLLEGDASQRYDVTGGIVLGST